MAPVLDLTCCHGYTSELPSFSFEGLPNMLHYVHQDFLS